MAGGWGLVAAGDGMMGGGPRRSKRQWEGPQSFWLRFLEISGRAERPGAGGKIMGHCTHCTLAMTNERRPAGRRVVRAASGAELREF